jgi:hypothetical protein
MYRPVQQQSQMPSGSVRTTLFSDKNYNTLYTVLAQDFQQRNGAALNEQQLDRLSKTLNHYLNQVYQVQGEKPLQGLNKEVLSASAKDFSQYLQRKEITKNTSPIKTVMDDGLFQETSQRFERLTMERNEVKALPPAMPDFRISLDDDKVPAAELFERAKKQREIEALRSSQQNNEMIKAEAGLQSRISADSMFRNQQDSQNRNTELALVQRQQTMTRPSVSDGQDMSLAIMPDRRDLLLAPIGSFDTMTGSPLPRELGQANSNPTIVQPLVASPTINNLSQNYLTREDKIVSYREIENNLFIYSADRDWLRSTKENRYHFTVNFDPGYTTQNFNLNLSAQQKFKNIVRIELIKCIMPGEGLDVTVERDVSGNYVTNYQDNILNLPYIIVRIEELENNNYGTDNYLDNAFGVLQYDAQWLSDTATQAQCTKGYVAMIPKFLKCQKEYYPTPLSTLQKLTVSLLRPNGEVISPIPDTLDIAGIIAPGAGAPGPAYPFDVVVSGTYATTAPGTAANSPANLFIVTNTYFSKFDICKGDRIQISGYTYTDAVLNDATYGAALRDFCNWINRPEGHIIISTAYTNTATTMADGFNSVGYANILIIQSRYQNPTTGSTLLDSFGQQANFAATLNLYGEDLLAPCKLIDLNKQLNLVFRVITREMDALPQIRPDNNY